MHRIISLFAVFVLSASMIAFADQTQQVFTLKDGSQIKGTLSGVSNGVYTVNTPIIGDVHIAAGDVALISNGNVPATAAAPANNTNSPAAPNQNLGTIPNLDQQVANSQKQLLSNPQSVETLQEMTQDPEIMQALSDPALVQAVTSHDYQAIQNNPNVQKLMSNPKMQAFIQKLAAQQQNNASQ